MKLAVDAHGIGGPRDAHVKVRLGMRCDHVACAAPANPAGADRHATLEVGKIANLLDLVRELMNRRVAAREVEPAVRGHAVNAQRVVAHALARGLVRTLQPLSGFQHKHCRRFQRQPLRDGTRKLAADFLVTYQQQRHRSIKQSGLLQHLQCRQRHGDAGLHIQHAGAADALFTVFLHVAKRHLRERADRPHRVEMAKQQQRTPSLAACETQLQHVARSLRLVPVSLGAQPRAGFGYRFHAVVHSGKVMRRRLDFHKLAQQSQQRGFGLLGQWKQRSRLK